MRSLPVLLLAIALAACAATFTSEESRAWNLLQDATSMWTTGDDELVTRVLSGDAYVDLCGVRGRGFRALIKLSGEFGAKFRGRRLSVHSHEVSDPQVTNTSARGTFNVVWNIDGTLVPLRGYHFVSVGEDGLVDTLITQVSQSDLSRFFAGGRTASETLDKLAELLEEPDQVVAADVFADEFIFDVLPGDRPPLTRLSEFATLAEQLSSNFTRTEVNELSRRKSASGSYVVEYTVLFETTDGCASVSTGALYVVLDEYNRATYVYNSNDAKGAMSCGEDASNRRGDDQ